MPIHLHPLLFLTIILLLLSLFRLPCPGFALSYFLLPSISPNPSSLLTPHPLPSVLHSSSYSSSEYSLYLYTISQDFSFFLTASYTYFPSPPSPPSPPPHSYILFFCFSSFLFLSCSFCFLHFSYSPFLSRSLTSSINSPFVLLNVFPFSSFFFFSSFFYSSFFHFLLYLKFLLFKRINLLPASSLLIFFFISSTAFSSCFSFSYFFFFFSSFYCFFCFFLSFRFLYILLLSYSFSFLLPASSFFCLSSSYSSSFLLFVFLFVVVLLPLLGSAIKHASYTTLNDRRSETYVHA